MRGRALVTAYPVMNWLAAAPSFGRLLAVELWLSVAAAVGLAAVLIEARGTASRSYAHLAERAPPT